MSGRDDECNWPAIRLSNSAADLELIESYCYAEALGELTEYVSTEIERVRRCWYAPDVALSVLRLRLEEGLQLLSEVVRWRSNSPKNSVLHHVAQTSELVGRYRAYIAACVALRVRQSGGMATTNLLSAVLETGAMELAHAVSRWGVVLDRYFCAQIADVGPRCSYTLVRRKHEYALMHPHTDEIAALSIPAWEGARLRALASGTSVEVVQRGIGVQDAPIPSVFEP